MTQECSNLILSPKLKRLDAKGYRSIVGPLLYMARDRLDIMLTVKELAAFMPKPILGAWQRLRKLVGFLKFTGDLGVKINIPESGMGKWKQEENSSGPLTLSQMLIGQATKRTGSQPHVGFTLSMEALCLAHQEHRR